MHLERYYKDPDLDKDDKYRQVVTNNIGGEALSNFDSVVDVIEASDDKYTALIKWMITEHGNVFYIKKKEDRIKEIQMRFQEKVLPHLQSTRYLFFHKIELNNARLLLFGTYMKDVAKLKKRRQDKLMHKIQHVF